MSPGVFYGRAFQMCSGVCQPLKLYLHSPLTGCERIGVIVGESVVHKSCMCVWGEGVVAGLCTNGWTPCKRKEEEIEEKQTEAPDWIYCFPSQSAYGCQWVHGWQVKARQMYNRENEERCVTPAVEYLKCPEAKTREACRDWLHQSTAGRLTQYM